MLSTLAAHHQAQGRYADAEPLFKGSLVILEDLLARWWIAAARMRKRVLALL
jgi:hypothetical protein